LTLSRELEPVTWIEAVGARASGRRRLSGLAADAGAKDPETLAEGLFVLLEGAYVSAALESNEGILDRTRLLARDLVSAAVARTGPRG
jgi:hypothetical protein